MISISDSVVLALYLSLIIVDIFQFVLQGGRGGNTFDDARCLAVAEAGIVSTLVIVSIGLIITDALHMPLSNVMAQAALVVASAQAVMFISFVTAPLHALEWIARLLLEDNALRLYLCLYWLVLIALAVCLGGYAARDSIRVTVRRKLFHFIAVAMFAPPMTHPKLSGFVALALAVGISALVVCESIRCVFGRDLAICKKMTVYYQKFLDEK
jgi:hypothetical protein